MVINNYSIILIIIICSYIKDRCNYSHNENNVSIPKYTVQMSAEIFNFHKRQTRTLCKQCESKYSRF